MPNSKMAFLCFLGFVFYGFVFIKFFYRWLGCVLLLFEGTKHIYTSVYTITLIMMFKAKIWKVGNSSVITVPIHYLNTGEFSSDELVSVEITKNKEDE